MASSDTPPEPAQPDDLYSVPLEEFIAARDRLAARLADAGQSDEAAVVAKLRKPSVAAWALNRASRHHPEVVDRLINSHRRLRAASTGELLQEASEERHTALAELLAVALTELTSDGRQASGQTRDRIARTLLAVATDAEAEEDLAAGRLLRETEPSGSGWADTGLAPAPAPDPVVRARADAEKARAAADKLRKELESAEQRVESAQRALSEAKRVAKEVRAKVKRAEADAHAAEAAAEERMTS